MADDYFATFMPKLNKYITYLDDFVKNFSTFNVPLGKSYI